MAASGVLSMLATILTLVISFITPNPSHNEAVYWEVAMFIVEFDIDIILVSKTHLTLLIISFCFLCALFVDRTDHVQMLSPQMALLSLFIGGCHIDHFLYLPHIKSKLAWHYRSIPCFLISSISCPPLSPGVWNTLFNHRLLLL